MDWDIIGHNWAVNLLRSQLVHNEQRHAYLITGPQGIGKRTLALRFAQALNCTNPSAPGVPCRQCRTCQQTERQQLPDLSIVTAASESTIKVDQIRELGRTLALTPYAAKTRVALLLNFDSATVSAQNALLKTLEEAPPKVVLIITALSSDSLLPTIVSRCELLRLRRMPTELLADNLNRRNGTSANVAMLLAQLSGGRMGLALTLNNDPALQDERQLWMSDVLDLLQSSKRERFAYALEACSKKNRERLKPLYQTWVLFWRDLLLSITNAKVSPINLDLQSELTLIAAQLKPETVEAALLATEKALDTLEKTNVNPQLLTEVLLLDWPKLGQQAV